MGRQVRIDGDPEVWEVLGETETTLLLVNPAARHRREIRVLEQQLAELQTRLDEAGGCPASDASA